MSPQFRRDIAAGLAIAACSALAACSAGDRSADRHTVELKLGHVGAPGSLYAVSAEEFARRVAERSQGRVRIAVFGSSQLGGDEVMMQKLKLGTLDLALPSTVMSSLIEAFGLFELPYLVQDREHMKRIEQEIVWPVLAPMAEEAGYKIIAVWENGFRHITNRVRPVVTPEDLKGIKLRVPRGRWRVRMFQAYGANPSPMPFAEVFVALQTGVMDGQENPLQQIYTSKLHEVQKYLSLTGHVYTPAFLTSGLQTWRSLPEEVRQLVEEVAKEVQPFVYQTAERMDREFLEALRQSGIAVNQADRERFAAASKPIYEEFATSVPGGRDLVTHALALRQQP
ncbi:Sialic acid-binding periplasmic protein SiaP [bacterium HR33]|nr:Sialic acid-binding periplasmic protein SiaP [bacterium HR33]